jgi:hypothetical protein
VASGLTTDEWYDRARENGSSMVPEAGAPKGKANGAWKHGHYSEAAMVERLLVKLLPKDVSSLRTLLSKGET